MGIRHAFMSVFPPGPNSGRGSAIFVHVVIDKLLQTLEIIRVHGTHLVHLLSKTNKCSLIRGYYTKGTWICQWMKCIEKRRVGILRLF